MRTIATVIAVFVILSVSGDAQTFQSRPPTATLNGSTAHTLRGGEFRIGSINLLFNVANVGTPFSFNQLKWLDVEYGLTDRLQIGTTVLENALEGPNAWAKFTAVRTRTLSLAMPLSIDVDVEPFGANVGSGLFTSWAPARHTSLHGGLRFWAFDGQIQLGRIAAALEVALFAHSHLFAEASVWPLIVEIGSLSRIGPLNLELSSRVLDAGEPNVDLELELFARF